MAAEWIPNPDLSGELRSDPAVLDGLLDVGLGIADLVDGQATIRRYGSETTAWIDGDHVVIARMEPNAAIDEYGTEHLAPSAALRNAIRATDGVTFQENAR